MSKARDLADFISTGSILSDGTLETVEIDGVTATPVELNKLDGATVTTDEINHLSGVTSAVQTQVDAKAPTASPTFTGTATTPTLDATTSIQLNGTEIVDSTRQLKNIASVDATTVAALGAAGVGGGGGSFDATASGAISAGDIVSLNSDGTVSTTSGFAGSPATFLSSSIEESRITYDSNSNKVVILYKQGSNSRTYAIVGTVSGTSISYGTATEIATSNNNYHDITFDSNSNKVVIAYRDQSDNNKVKAAVGTVSGTSISFGTIVDVTSQAASFPKLAFDSNSNKVVVAYKDNYDGSVGKAAVGTVSGTSISFGTPVVYQNTNNQPSSNVFDSNSNKIVIGFKHDADSDDGKAVVGTVSGTSISFGTPVTFTTGNGEVHASTFDSNSNKVVIVFRDNNNSGKLSGIVGTVSGTSISFGSTVAISTGSFSDPAVTFDSNINKVIVLFRDVADTNDGKLVSGTVSGTSISFGTSVTFNDGNILRNSIVFDSSANKVVLAYYNDATGLSQGLVGIPQGIDNFLKYLGFSSENIADGSTGVINVLGGVNENQSSLNIGSTYYLSDAATINTTAVTGREVGRALSATKLLITQGSIS